MYTHVLLENDSKKEIKAFVDKLSRAINDLLSGRLSITYGKDIIHMSPVDIVRAIAELSIDSSAELSIRNMFLSSITEAENRCKFTGFVAALTACNAIKSMLKFDSMDMDYIREVAQNDLITLSHNSHEASFVEAMDTIKKITRDKLVHSILQETLTMAGASGKVLVDLTPNNETFISSFVGYKFPLSPHHLFSSAGCGQQWNRQQVLCLVIDGIIERVSEIEKIIQPLAKDKIPGIIFARGYSDEVVSTLAVNFLRNSLDIVPIVVPFDETGINMLNDIAVIVGSDVVSSLKGELISQKTKDDLMSIDEVKINNNEVVLCHNEYKENVLKHIIHLKKSENSKFNFLDASEDDSKKSLIEKRILSLTGEGVQIKVGMSVGQKRGIILDRIQSDLDIFKSICYFGVVDIENYQANSELISAPIHHLRKIGYHMPTASLLSGLQYGLQIGADISSLSAIVSCDN
jgi:hypothetical protein